jgi:hypothetical protein
LNLSGTFRSPVENRFGGHFRIRGIEPSRSG